MVAGPREELAEVAAGPRDTAAGRDAAARASFQLAELDGRARDYASAMKRYRDVLAIDPGNYFAGAARARVEALAPYEGAFTELAALDAVRRDPARASDPAAVDALAALTARWSGRVRADALLFIAEAYIGRLKQPARGAEPALEVARTAIDRVQRDAAWDLAWAALRDDLPRAKREIADDARAPAALRARVLREVRRRGLHRASSVALGAGGGLALVALALAVRRGRLAVVRAMITRPAALAFLVVMPFFGATVANAWDHHLGDHFWPFAGALLAVHVFVAAWRGAFGDRPRGYRLLGGVTAALCVLAAAYLVLERGEAYGTPLLEGFGL